MITRSVVSAFSSVAGSATERASFAHWFNSDLTKSQNVSGSTVYDNRLLKGTARAVQPGRFLTFDGTNGKISIPDVRSLVTNATIELYFKNTGTSGVLLSDSISGVYYIAAFESGNVSTVLNQNSGSTIKIYINDILFTGTTRGQLYTALTDGTWKRIKITGVVTTSWPNGIIIGYAVGSTYRPTGGIHSYKIDFTSDGTWDINYPMCSASGTTAYDVSGNARHGTHSGGVTHSTDTTGYGNDSLNLHGYLLSGGVYIPLTVSSLYTVAADGNAATVTGEVPYNATITGHDGVTNGVHSGCTVNFNPNGSPKLANASAPTAYTYGSALPARFTKSSSGGVEYDFRFI